MGWSPLDLLRPLFDFLICLVAFAAGTILAGLTLLGNLLVAALALLANLGIALLPTIDLGSEGPPPILAWANWALPLDHLIAIVAVSVVVLGAWHLIAIVLRWGKVVE